MHIMSMHNRGVRHLIKTAVRIVAVSCLYGLRNEPQERRTSSGRPKRAASGLDLCSLQARSVEGWQAATFC